MSHFPLAPTALERVRSWLDTSDVVTSLRLTVVERSRFAGAWELKEHYPHLGNVRPRLLLPHGFPFTPLRVELDSTLCLKLPHIEAKGNFCHGILPEPSHLDDPIRAAGLVLEALVNYVERSADAKWVEEEFQRESHDYWLRHAAAANAPKKHQTEELFLDVDPPVEHLLRAEALQLASRTRAIVSTREGGPKALTEAIGWSLGPIVHGSALIAPLAQNRRWTPDVWPRSFDGLATLVDEITGTAGATTNWCQARKWPNEAPLFIILQQGSVAYGWRIIMLGTRTSAHANIIPVKVSRIDRRWALARDHEQKQLDDLTGKHVVVFGCGSLGAPSIELLARAGVGTVEVVDPETLRPENVSRHPLGIRSIGLFKAKEICARLTSGIPGVKVTPHTSSAQQWLAEAHPLPHLLLDCTGERAVRMAIAHARNTTHKSVPTMMAWLEPFGAAAHVVTILGPDSWPTFDPAETAINVARWPDGVERRHPGCGQGYHPFGMADAWEAASLVTRRAAALLRGEELTSDVLSQIRHRRFFESIAPGVSFNRHVDIPDGVEALIERRPLAEAIREV